MDAYVQRLLAQAPLTREEEVGLARRARNGDAAARSALVVAGMRSVAQRALMRGLRGEDLRDGVQAGALGLIRAVDRFDPDRGVRLATFAWAWIGAALVDDRPPEVELAHDRVDPRGRDDAAAWLDGLSPLGADVVRLRFGVGGQPPLSRREVAGRLCLSESRVRTVEAEAMRHLRRSLGRIGPRAAPSGQADPP
jgi:RNA polymerase sigma factor (sigma-70 family)